LENPLWQQLALVEALANLILLLQLVEAVAVAADSVLAVLVVLAVAVLEMVLEGLAPQDRVKTVVIVLGNSVALAVAVLAV
jgi:hypothetical protein